MSLVVEPYTITLDDVRIEYKRNGPTILFRFVLSSSEKLNSLAYCLWLC
uniref:Uncharacterized protein n=1 Tax=Arundo donax TaxID=35708 RepID=A0A0A9FMM1_ARUDO